MQQMTEREAIAHGLTVVTIEHVPASTSPAERADRASVLADELAAVVESVLRDADPHLAVVLEEVRDGLGALHVEADELAEEIRSLAASLPWAGAA